MKKSDITYIVGVVFAAMTSFFYCCTRWFGIIGKNLPRYYPVEHTWKWVKEPNVPSQGWYAMQVFAFVCAGVVALVVYLLLKRRSGNEAFLAPRLTKALGLAAVGLIMVCMAYIIYYEFDKCGIL